MKSLSTLPSSRALSRGLFVIIAASIAADHIVNVDSRNWFYRAEKEGVAINQVGALTQAIEQYFIDFPDAGEIANNADWVSRLEGHNPQRRRYLKVERFQRDSFGRLVDPDGNAYVIETERTPGFEPTYDQKSDQIGEFHVGISGAEGVGTGHIKNSTMGVRFPRD